MNHTGVVRHSCGGGRAGKRSRRALAASRRAQQRDTYETSPEACQIEGVGHLFGRYVTILGGNMLEGKPYPVSGIMLASTSQGRNVYGAHVRVQTLWIGGALKQAVIVPERRLLSSGPDRLEKIVAMA